MFDTILYRLVRNLATPAIGFDKHGKGPSLPILLLREEVQFALLRNWIKLRRGFQVS